MVRIRSPQYLINIFTNEYFVCPCCHSFQFFCYTLLYFFLQDLSVAFLNNRLPFRMNLRSPLQCMGRLIPLVQFCLERLVGCCRSKLVVMFYKFFLLSVELPTNLPLCALRVAIFPSVSPACLLGVPMVPDHTSASFLHRSIRWFFITTLRVSMSPLLLYNLV